ncbi:AP-1 complex subunit gamma-1 [Tritrichomonas musculus]|uniref:AP-1 complex subunit gamma n=1 Tax=Tritrichomonas musculus TaxID=1915356 RepID=A0ABR2KH65_9EUKA
MTQELNDFISSVRLADTIEHEKFLIHSEQANMRSYVRECDPTMRPRIVAKLLFLCIYGENVSYGQMEAITLMSQERLSYKRIGYVAAGVILDEQSELTVLITHTITKDLESKDPHVQCLALSFIANMGSVELCQAVTSHIIRLSESPSSLVMKRSAMAACRIVQRVPDVADTFKPIVNKLLKNGSHGVVIAAINLMDNIIQAKPSMKSAWLRYVPAFTKILRQLNQSKASREFQFTVFNDPFLQFRLMKILGILNRPSDELDDVLESITTGVDIRRNSGRSLLFQAVDTIVLTAKKPSLRGLAFSQIGRLFQFKEANVLYSALSVYSRILYSGREIVGRTSVDTIALQRYKTQVVKCLSHRDSSIRRRALDVVSALVDEKNVESLVPEVLDYVKLADSEFRVELVGKIFTAIQRFSPNSMWTFDMVHRILIDNGNYVGNDIITNFCRLISRTPELQQHAVHQLGASMLNFSDDQALMQVTAWVLGEYMIRDDENGGGFDSLSRVLLMPQTTPATKGYIITALGKLAVRFSKKQELVELLKPLMTNSNLDVQQRAGEISAIVEMNDVCEDILSSNEPNDNSMSASSSVTNFKSNSITNLNAYSNNKANTNKNDDDEDDLLLILDAPSQNEQQNNATSATNNTSAVDDILSLVPPSSSGLDSTGASTISSHNSISTVATNSISGVTGTNNSGAIEQNGPIDLTQKEQSSAEKIKPPPGAVEGLRTPDYVIYFEIRKNPQNQKQIAIRASIFNLGSMPLNNFNIKYGVPYGWFIQTQSQSSTKLEPIGGMPILQQMMAYTQTDTILMMKTQISYIYGSQPIVENGEVAPIFG